MYHFSHLVQRERLVELFMIQLSLI